MKPTGGLWSAMRRLWSKILRVWAVFGTIALIVFAVWMLIGYRASSGARAALQDNQHVDVARCPGYWLFRPRAGASHAGLLFFPGGLVEPAAYAPLVRSVAGAGYAGLLVELPRRGAFGGADGPEVILRAQQAMQATSDVTGWVVAGHSRGGAVATRLVYNEPDHIVGLVLIATSHPRDFSLANTTVPVTRVFGTRDTIADVDKLEATQRNLPETTRMVAIEGGNHSQFGYYGFQLGDWFATIGREEQQRRTQLALIEALDTAARGVSTAPTVQ